MNQDLYGELGLDKGAAVADIKKAYRRLAKQYHPDRNRDNPAAEERFKKISAAYAVLSDPKKRQLYDQYGIDGLRDGFDPNVWKQYQSGGRRGGGVDFGGFSDFGGMEDLFETLFGARRQSGSGAPIGSDFPFGGRQRGSDVRYSMEVELLDAVLGRELEIAIPVQNETKRLKVRLPAGISSGQTIRLKQQGQAGGRGGPSGDLLVEITVTERGPYRRQGNDLVKEQRITIGQAYRGDVIEVETPHGKGKLTIPPGTQGGAGMRIKGHGVRTDRQRGDLIVQLQIQIPTQQDDETRELVEKLESRY